MSGSPALRFAMIPALALRILLLLVCFTASAETLDEAIASLAKKVSARLASTETARVTARNSTSLPAAEATRAQAADLAREGAQLFQAGRTAAERVVRALGEEEH